MWIIGFGLWPASANSNCTGLEAWAGATSVIRSSAFTRLCAWRALLALALKRAMNDSRWAMCACCFTNADCCTASCIARSFSKVE